MRLIVVWERAVRNKYVAPHLTKFRENALRFKGVINAVKCTARASCIQRLCWALEWSTCGVGVYDNDSLILHDRMILVRDVHKSVEVAR